MKSLTYKQRLFIYYFCGVSRGNAVDAARRAGYSSPRQSAEQLSHLPAIQAHIDGKLDAVGMPQDEVLARTAEIAGFDIGDLIDLKPDGTWQFNIARAKRKKQSGTIRKLKQTRVTRTFKDVETVTETVEVETYSKLDALDKLLRYHGLYKEKIDITTAGEKIRTILYLPENGRDPEQRNDNPDDSASADSGEVPSEPS